MYRQGYFQNEQEQEAAIGRLIVDHQQAQRRLAGLLGDADRLSKRFHGLADNLITRLAPIDTATTVQAVEMVNGLNADIRATRAEIERLAGLLKDIGAL